MESKKDIRRVEYYLNEKLYKDVPYSQWTDTAEKIKHTLFKNKYVHNYSSEYMNRLPETWEVYVLPEKFKVVVVSHPILFGDHTAHSQIKVEGATPISAGFVQFDSCGLPHCTGRSDSLKLESRGEKDEDIIHRAHNLSGGTMLFIADLYED